MPSFDIVSELNRHELTNAVDQTNREVGNRYDFKGSNAKVVESENELSLEAQTKFQIDQIRQVLHQKMSKRGIDISAIESGEVEERGKVAIQKIVLKEGIDKEVARKIIKSVKESKLKVQAAIQGEQVRITGKKRDDLQQVIAFIKSNDFGQPLQFNNFRD